MKRTYQVRVRWMAEAVVEVKAASAEDAEDKVRDRGIPWKYGVEADDGDAYSVEVLDENGDEDA